MKPLYFALILQAEPFKVTSSVETLTSPASKGVTLNAGWAEKYKRHHAKG